MLETKNLLVAIDFHNMEKSTGSQWEPETDWTHTGLQKLEGE